jgi:hypothetical protein
MDFFRKHKKKQAEDVKQQNTGTNDRKEESKLGDNVFNTAQQQLGDRKELEKKTRATCTRPGGSAESRYCTITAVSSHKLKNSC